MLEAIVGGHGTVGRRLTRLLAAHVDQEPGAFGLDTSAPGQTR